MFNNMTLPEQPMIFRYTPSWKILGVFVLLFTIMLIGTYILKKWNDI